MFMSASGHLDELLIGPFRVPMGPSQATMTPSWAVLARCRHVAVCDTARPALLPLPAPQEANHRDIRRRWVLQSGCTAARHKQRAGLFLASLLVSLYCAWLYSGKGSRRPVLGHIRDTPRCAVCSFCTQSQRDRNGWRARVASTRA